MLERHLRNVVGPSELGYRRHRCTKADPQLTRRNWSAWQRAGKTQPGIAKVAGQHVQPDAGAVGHELVDDAVGTIDDRRDWSSLGKLVHRADAGSVLPSDQGMLGEVRKRRGRRCPCQVVSRAVAYGGRKCTCRPSEPIMVP